MNSIMERGGLNTPGTRLSLILRYCVEVQKEELSSYRVTE